jgi:hypothetical protein
MEPRADLGSTGYLLANPGKEYLTLQPEAGAAFTPTMEPGRYAVEWFSVEGRATVEADDVTAQAHGPVTFEPPFAGGPAVVYLKAR